MHKLAVVAALFGAGIANADTDRPTVSYGAAIVTGTYDAKAITAVVKRSQKTYLACYTKARTASPALDGTANATFTIAVDGKPMNVAVSGLSEDADKCLALAVAKLVFKKPRAAVEVTIPLTFKTVVETSPSPKLTEKEADIYGGLLGNEVEGEMSGGFGFGRAGFGADGGGTGWGTIGTGRYGQIGKGGGTGSGYGVGGGRGGMRGRTSGPTASIGQPKAVGDLDKAIIRRYIKRNLAKLQYCYEKELLSKPTIAGTVTAEFTIGGDGRVTSSTATGVDTNVEACVASVIKAVEFPKPKNQRAVNVTYPFTFRPAEEPAKK